MTTTDGVQSTVHDWPVGTLAEISWPCWTGSENSQPRSIAHWDGTYWRPVGPIGSTPHQLLPYQLLSVRPVKVVPVDAVVLEVETRSLLSEWHPRTLRDDAAFLDERLPVTARRLEVIADAIERARPDEVPELPSKPGEKTIKPVPDCDYCTTRGYDHRRVGSKPFGVFVASERDSDGQPTHLSVSYTAGEHVGEGEAEYVRRALRAYAAQYRPELPSDPSGGVATPDQPGSVGSVDAEAQESAEAAKRDALEAEVEQLTAELARYRTAVERVRSGLAPLREHARLVRYDPFERTYAHGVEGACDTVEADLARALNGDFSGLPSSPQLDRDAALTAVRKCSPWLKRREVERVVDAVFSTLGGQR